jgi:Squalene-hopene cyclase C-terminal domain
MLKRVTASCLILAGLSSTVHILRSQSGDAGKTAEVKAVEFLKREVPAWSKNNGCFSCHNNGDAARALYRASQQDYRISVDVLADTTAWLAEPQLWDKNKGDPGSSDKRLANLQFALALLTALQTGYVSDKKGLQVAARRVAGDQHPSGAWLIDSGTAVGSPATYGSTLSTAMACRVLRASGLEEHQRALVSAEAWLRRAPVNSVTAAAALLLAAESHSAAKPRRSECLAIIERAQTQDGGWGPYVDSPPEVFDTAIVLLALAAEKHEGMTGRILRARNFLATQQNPDGGWPATTRPPGGESYAQRLSTTGWATLALLATRE